MEQILKTAIEGLDADYAEIRIEQSESTHIAYMGPVLERIGTVFSIGGCVRVCVKGGWGFVSFNRIENARQSALDACKLAHLIAQERTILAPVSPVIATIINPVSHDPTLVSLSEKEELTKNYNTLMLHDKNIITTQTTYRDTKKTLWFHTNDGTQIKQEKIYTGISFVAVARDGTNIQRGRRSFGDRRGYATVLNREGDVEQVMKITRDLIQAPKVEGGVYDVILDPELAGVFVHEAFGHMSEADFIYENPKAQEMMTLGRRFGPEFLNVIDDGTLEGENGHTPYDDEGVKGNKTFLIKEGILVGRLHSRETAGRMNEQPSGNARAIDFAFRPIVRMTNTYIDKGEFSRHELFGRVKNGIYACGFIGGMTDLERFTFSSAYAYKIENGRLTTPLRDVILSGNVFETLNNITMIGNDLTLFGGLGGCGKGGQSPLPVTDGSPHILITRVLVG